MGHMPLGWAWPGARTALVRKGGIFQRVVERKAVLLFENMGYRNKVRIWGFWEGNSL